MSATTPQNLRASFPLPSSPLVDLNTGNINSQWLDFLLAEFARTGGATGPSADLATVATLAFGAVRRSGDTMTGGLILSGPPVVPLQAATKAYVDAGGADPVLPATALPFIDGTAAVGTSLLYARQDHVHPTDISRAPLDLLSVARYNVAGGSNVTLTAAQSQFACLEFYGALSANITITLPVATSAVQIWTVGNQCSGNGPLLDGTGNLILDGSGNVITDGVGYTITLQGTAGGAITLPQGAFETVRTDGTGVYTANTVASISSGSIDGAPVGAYTPASGAFTTLSVSGTVSGVGFTALLAPYVTIATLAALVPVQSVVGRIGEVTLGYTDISGLATVAHTGAYADLSGTPAVVSPGTVAPLIDGTAAVGASLLYARQDHVHPTDISRYAASNPAGYITASGAPVQSVAGRIGAVVLTYTDISGLATVAHTGAYSDLSGTPAVVSAATAAPLVDGTAAVGTSLLYARQDHVHPTDTSRYAASNPSGYQTAAQVSTSLSAYAPLAGATFSGPVSVSSSLAAASATITGAASVGGALVVAGVLDVAGNAAITGTFSAGQTTVTGPMTITGAASVGGVLNVAGNAAVAGTFSAGQTTVTGPMTITGAASVGGALSSGPHTVTGGQTVTGAASVGSSLNVAGNAAVTGTFSAGQTTVTGPMTITGAASVGGVLNVGSNAAVYGTFSAGQTTVTGPMTITGAASVGGSLNAGTTTITDTVGGGTSLVIHATVGAGANLGLYGNGATTPNKTIRVNGGNLQFLSSNYSTTIFNMDDAGNATVAGGHTITGAASVGGSLNAGITSITDPSGGSSSLLVSATGGNGANIKFIGSGTPPNKALRAINGHLQVVNSAYSAVIWDLDDSGNNTVSGSGTVIGGLQVNGSASCYNFTVNGGATVGGSISSGSGNFAGGTSVALTASGSSADSAAGEGNVNLHVLSTLTSGGEAVIGFDRQAQLATKLSLTSDGYMAFGGWSWPAKIWKLDGSGNTTQTGGISVGGNAAISGYVTGNVATVTPAGSTQGTATSIGNLQYVEIASGSSGQGIILVTPSGATSIHICNLSAVTILVYPPSGTAFCGLGTNVAYSLASGNSCIATFYATTTWSIK